MPRARPRPTLIDLMATIGAVALSLGLVTWLAPGRILAMLIVIAPTVGILWDRRRGGRGILGGVVHAVACLVYYLSGLGGVPLGRMFRRPGLFLTMTALCAIFGAIMGLTAWLGALAMGSSRIPAPVEVE